MRASRTGAALTAVTARMNAKLMNNLLARIMGSSRICGCCLDVPTYQYPRTGDTLQQFFLMTSFAFVLGVFPLVIAEEAGAEMRRTLGTAVFAGMIGVTFVGIFLTPVFFYVVRRISGPRSPAMRPEQSQD